MDQTPQFQYSKKQAKLNRVLTVGVMAAAFVVILFPLILRAKAKMVDRSCAANLRQIGQAMHLYAADSDERMPLIVDASDKTLGLWDRQPKQAALVKKLPYMQKALARYVKSPTVFKCPLDNGGYVMDNTFGSEMTTFGSAPTMYDTYGSSYLYRTEITFKAMDEKGFWPAADVAMMFDAYGHWHGRTAPITPDMSFRRMASDIQNYRYNALFGDGHVETLNYNELQLTWTKKL